MDSYSSDEEIQLQDESDCDFDTFCDEMLQETQEYEKPIEAAVVSDYVLVKFATKKTLKFFVGLIQEKLPDGDYVVKFLRKTKKSAFYWPEVNFSVHCAL